MTASRRTPARGFGVIAAIVLLVVLSALAAAIVRFGSVAQVSAAQGVTAARVSATARAGTEWGLYQAFKGAWTACAGAGQTLDLTASTGFHVSVSCDSRTFNDGETVPGTPRTVRLYTIDAVACSSSACPDNSAATTPNYVERRRQVQASDQL